jgi:hypothetical protein
MRSVIVVGAFAFAFLAGIGVSKLLIWWLVGHA